MTYDLKIEGGTIIDGTGRAGQRGDVGIKDGRIVAVGDCEGSADEVLDAQGAIVIPGFVDIHTHYDGQVSWDPELAPSSLHGVTTCVMGSCGVGFAPVHARDRQRIIELMEGVEDIPGSALAEGITWGWESFGEYMDAIDRFPHAIDFAVQVPHDVLRVYVMGERAVAGQAATDDDIARMRALVREALQAGAAGFSTGRTDNHRTAQGQPTPASEATVRELTGIAGAFEGLGHGVLQAVSDFDLLVSDDRFHDEFDVIERMAAAAPGHGTSISLMQRDQSPQQWRWIIERAERAQAAGTTIRLQVAPRPIGVMLGLRATFHPFMGFPSYKEISALPLAEQVAALRDPQRRARILSEKTDKVAGDGSSLPPLADILLAQIDMVAKRLYRLGGKEGERPDYEPDPRTCLWAEAQATGRSILEVLYDAMLEDEGRALLYFPLYNFTGLDLEAVHTMLTHPLALPGLSDGGAHVGTICDASFPTYLLSHWGRDRPRGRIPLERLVQFQTQDTARFIGLHDRGTIEVGRRADLNVIDLPRLGLRTPQMQKDLPAGGRRLMQRADGYRATLVAGRVVAREGVLTGERPGRLVRVGRS
ncbi:N-acyl-D-amino-acid deacylase family protein [Paraliomyxa miuraensis]|uniref:N-acyl-D-amino-acid deacylase family protein n=1 Tax=Paraliomyxa miuraensis TaxID=376150 RepID=UPI00224E02C9|nr:amidohydrolase family protein [Paraliomyxa miuraensis]MCX4240740.1 amidohydrolase family protein [Paraliomyxa miuraensis]